MAGVKILKKLFNIFKGLNLSSGDVLTSEEFASELENADVDLDGRITKRKGYTRLSANGPGHGVFSFFTPDALGNDQEVLLGFKEDQLQKQVTGSWLSADHPHRQVDGATAIDHPLDGLNSRVNSSTGDKVEHPTATSINGNAYISTGFTNLFKYDGYGFYRAGMPGYELNNVDYASFDTQVATVTGGGAGTGSSRTNAHRVQFSYVDAQGITYEGNISGATDRVSTGTIDDVLSWYVDFPVPAYNRGYLTNFGVVKTNATATNTFVVEGIITATHGVTSGATLYQGMVVAVQSRPSTGGTKSDVQYYRVSTVNDDYLGTTGDQQITLLNLDLSAPSFALDAGDVISAMTAKVWRHAGSITGTADADPMYLVDEFPITPYAVSSVGSKEFSVNYHRYTDDTPDDVIQYNQVLINPVESNEQAPKGKYIHEFRNKLVISGDPDNFSRVAYSNTLNVEGFAQAISTNYFNVGTPQSGSVTGIGSIGASLFIFKEKAIFQVTGDLGLDSFRVDEVPNSGMGCVAHHTIKKVGKALFFLGRNGVYALDEAGNISEVTVPISTKFTTSAETYDAATDGFIGGRTLKRALAVTHAKDYKYVLYLPFENYSSGYIGDIKRGSLRGTDLVLVFDYRNPKWLIYKNINCDGGLEIYQDTPIWVENNINGGTSVSQSTHQMNSTRTATESLDQPGTSGNAAISMTWKTPWITLGETSTLKKMLRLRVFSMLTVNQRPAAFTLSMAIESNWVAGTNTSSTTLSFGSSDVAKTMKLRKTKNTAVRVIFSNAVSGELPFIDGFEIEFAAPYRQGIKD